MSSFSLTYQVKLPYSVTLHTQVEYNLILYTKEKRNILLKLMYPFLIIDKIPPTVHKDNKSFSQLQEIDRLVLSLEIPLLSLFLPRTNPTFNLIIISQLTSNITDSLMRPTLAKLVKEGITACSFSGTSL